jgi:tetratricopeptide (TPR) repeat protein
MKALAVALLLAAAPASGVDAPPPAAVDDATVQAKAHFKRGAELYREARYREAIAEFEEANRLRPHGVIFYNLAQCHERLGDLAAALRAYHEYLRAVPGASDVASVNAAMANLEARLGASGVQQLLVYSEPPDAEVYVDGMARGRTPFAAVLPHGAHKLRVVKEGFATVSRDAVLASDRSLELDLALAAVTANANSTPNANANATLTPNLSPAPAQTATVSLQPSPPEAKPAGPRSRVWTWVAAGASVAALAAGGAYGLSARSASSDLHSAQHDAKTAQRLADAASSRARTANLLYAAGAVAGAGSVGVFFVEGKF